MSAAKNPLAGAPCTSLDHGFDGSVRDENGKCPKCAADDRAVAPNSSAAPHSDLPLCDNPECTRADHLIGATRSPYTESEQRMLRFIDAISPFIEDVLDQPFPWKSGGQVITWMSREQYDEALEALNALRD